MRIFNYIILTNIIILLYLVFTPFLSAKEKNEYNQEIGKAWEEKDYSSGSRTSYEAIKEYPGDSFYHLSLIYFLMNEKKYDESVKVARNAVQKFPEDKKIKEAAANNYLGAGWAIYEKQKLTAHTYFKDAYLLNPSEQWAINAEAVRLRDVREFQKAADLFKKGISMYPGNPHLKSNLFWTMYDLADEHRVQGNITEAKKTALEAYESGNQTTGDVHRYHLYFLIRINDYDEAVDIFRKQLKLLSREEQNKIIEPGFWSLFYKADQLLTKKDYIATLEHYDELYKLSLTADAIKTHSKPENGFKEFSANQFFHTTNSIISGICPYYKIFNNEEKKQSDLVLSKLHQLTMPELSFIYYNYSGQALYRENKVKEAYEDMTRSRSEYLQSFGKKYRDVSVTIPFPMKGDYQVLANESRSAITHMGHARYASDFFGIDANLKLHKKSTDGTQAEHFHGFGAIIYSPVDGLVENVVDGFNDDSPSQSIRSPKGNNLQILSNGLLYHFYHLKKGSIKVKKGDRIKAGTPVAMLGNSNSRIPHLHFAVYTKDWMLSVPVNFTNYKIYREGKWIDVQNERPGRDDTIEYLKIDSP